MFHTASKFYAPPHSRCENTFDTDIESDVICDNSPDSIYWLNINSGVSHVFIIGSWLLIYNVMFRIAKRRTYESKTALAANVISVHNHYLTCKYLSFASLTIVDSCDNNVVVYYGKF